MRRRMRFGLVAVTLVGIVGAVGASRLAVRVLDSRVRTALGERIEVGQVTLGWSALELTDVRLPAPPDWPVREALAIRRVVLRPRLATLLGPRVAIDAVEVEDFYLAARRMRGRPLEILPGIAAARPPSGTDATATGAANGRRAIAIARLTFRDGVVEMFDGTVATPPHRTRLGAFEATIENVEAPAGSGRSRVVLAARLEGPRRHGRLAMRGHVTLGDGNAHLTTDLTGADLAVFRPWLGRNGAVLRGGAIDVHLDSTVRDGRVHAPGRLTLSHVSLARGRDLGERLLALPREAAFKVLAGASGGRLRVGFVLEGPLSAPRLRITDAPGRQLAEAFAGILDATPAGAAKGAGAVGQAGAATVQATARGAASAIQRLFR